MVKKYDIVLVNLEPARGAEKRGVRPCLIVQNNPVNRSQIQTVIVVPFTSTSKKVPSAVWVVSNEINGLVSDSRIEISQIRSVDKGRIGKKLGHLEFEYFSQISKKISNFLDLEDEF